MLGPDDRTALKDFVETCQLDKVRALRDVLEHEEQIVSGHGQTKRRAITYSGPYPNTPIPAWHSHDRRFYKIDVLGQTFDIERSLTAATNLRPVLSHILDGYWATPSS